MKNFCNILNSLLCFIVLGRRTTATKRVIKKYGYLMKAYEQYKLVWLYDLCTKIGDAFYK